MSETSKQEQARTKKREEIDRALRAICALDGAATIVFSWLVHDECGVLDYPGAPNADMHIAAGRRRVALEILSRLGRVAPEIRNQVLTSPTET